jgi:hypothetical protein
VACRGGRAAAARRRNAAAAALLPGLRPGEDRLEETQPPLPEVAPEPAAAGHHHY